MAMRGVMAEEVAELRREFGLVEAEWVRGRGKGDDESEAVLERMEEAACPC